MKNTKNCFRYLALQNTCTPVGYLKSYNLENKLKLDCSNFIVLEINGTVEITYINY